LTAGVGALATKAAAGLAVAAIVTAGTVEAEHASSRARHHHATVSPAAVAGIAPASEPVVTRTIAQPLSVAPPARRTGGSHITAKPAIKAKATLQAPAAPVASAAPPRQVDNTQTVALKPPTVAEKQATPPPVTQVTTESTQLPSQPAQAAGGGSAGKGEGAAVEATVTTPATSTTATTGGTEATPPPTSTTTSTETPPPPPPPAPASEASSGAQVSVGVPVSVVVAPRPDPAPGAAGEEPKDAAPAG
jgi:hypothetical protein